MGTNQMDGVRAKRGSVLKWENATVNCALRTVNGKLTTDQRYTSAFKSSRDRSLIFW